MACVIRDNKYLMCAKTISFFSSLQPSYIDEAVNRAITSGLIMRQTYLLAFVEELNVKLSK